MPDRLSAQRIPYTPSSRELLGPGLRVELEQLDDLTPAQLETVLAYAAEDGQLVSIIRPTGLLPARERLHFQTLELATGLTYEHKLEPNGRAWHLGQAEPGNAWTHPPPGPTR